MRIVLFLDLDDTVFQTMPKCPAGEAVHPVAFGKDGAPLSYMTARQRTLLDVWFRFASVIPTTARSLDAYRRVKLPFDHLAILDFGGVILHPDGTLDSAWDARIRPQVLQLADQLHTLHGAIERFNVHHRLGIRARIIADFNMPLYVVLKHPDGDCTKLHTIRNDLFPKLDLQSFFVHENGNNLSLVPAFLGKEHAVKQVIEHHLGTDPVLTIGMGDSLTDAAFLERCDFSLMPRACQLAQQRI
jgi:hydroxymethylpyrimidine pyrophosphatase-like HAD family hydrolase